MAGMSFRESFLAKVNSFIQKNNLIRAGDHVLVGVSGGPDSVCLLKVLSELSRGHGYTVSAAHLNHMFREEARYEQEFVEDLAGRLGVPVYLGSCDVPALVTHSGRSAQDVARQVRYEFLRRVARDIGADLIAVGHHADDQAETVLMHLIQGSGAPGLGGMSPREGEIIRPLLGVFRRDVEKFLEEEGLSFVSDSSNYKPVYLRNKIRLTLIPLLKNEYNPRLAEALVRTAEVIRGDDEYLQQLTHRVFEQVTTRRDGGEVCLDAGKLAELHPAMQRRLIRRLYQEVGGSQGLGYFHVEKTRELIFRDRGRWDLPGGISAIKIPGHLCLIPKTEELHIQFQYPLEIPGEVQVEEAGLTVRGEVCLINDFSLVKACPSNEAYLDEAILDYPLMLRNTRPGDRFMPLGMKCFKKLHDFFIDAKVPRDQRIYVPLLVVGEEIAWVVGYRIDGRFALKQGAREAVHLVTTSTARISGP